MNVANVCGIALHILVMLLAVKNVQTYEKDFYPAHLSPVIGFL